MGIAENKARYEGSALQSLMESSGHEICERCYCCDAFSESAPCWQCGGFEEEDDGMGFPPDVCSVCGGEGEVYWKVCAGGCDENGENHKDVPVPMRREEARTTEEAARVTEEQE